MGSCDLFEGPELQMKILREMQTQQSFFRSRHTHTHPRRRLPLSSSSMSTVRKSSHFQSTAPLTRGDNPSVGTLWRLLWGFAAWLIIPPPPPRQLPPQSSDTRADPSRHYDTDLRCNLGSLMKCFQHARFHHFLSEAGRG